MTVKLLIYIIIMAGVTYLIRMLPFAAFRKQIKSRYIRSCLYYIPYAVLGAMTIPAIFYSTGNVLYASVGFAAAAFFDYKNRSLLTVAVAASAAVYLASIAADLYSRFCL